MVFRARRLGVRQVVLVLVALMLLAYGVLQPAASQSVGWLTADDESYLTSSGMTVMVPSYVPGPFSGSAPEVSASPGTYSVYFSSGGTFLYITGVAGGGFPGGSEANLNVELSINASVLGYPAIQDIGIPEGSSTPIYDKVMWIADGVLYTIYGNGLDTDSLTLANSSVAIAAAPQPEPTDPPAVEQPTTAPPTDDGTSPSDDDVSPTSTETSTAGDSAAEATGGDDESTAQPTPPLSDGTDGPAYSPISDGTDGTLPIARPDDGTGGS